MEKTENLQNDGSNVRGKINNLRQLILPAVDINRHQEAKGSI